MTETVTEKITETETEKKLKFKIQKIQKNPLYQGPGIRN